MPKSLRERWKESKRQISRKYFWTLLLRQKHLCFWCKGPLVRVKNIKASLRIKETHCELTYRSNGIVITQQKATIDHLVPISRMGSPKIENLVVACVRCNERRGVACVP